MWTDERVELLRKLWAEGLTASQIADRLGGVSRSGVLGKLHRIDPDRPPRRRKGGPSSTRRRRDPSRNSIVNKALSRKKDPGLPAPKPRPTEEPVSLRIPLMGLNDSMCKYSASTELPYLFCGHRAEEGFSYCEFHRDLTHTPPNRELSPEERDRRQASAKRAWAKRMAA